MKQGFKLNPGFNFARAHRSVSILLHTWPTGQASSSTCSACRVPTGRAIHLHSALCISQPVSSSSLAPRPDTAGNSPTPEQRRRLHFTPSRDATSSSQPPSPPPHHRSCRQPSRRPLPLPSTTTHSAPPDLAKPLSPTPEPTPTTPAAFFPRRLPRSAPSPEHR
jgi:hypothetical protein